MTFVSAPAPRFSADGIPSRVLLWDVMDTLVRDPFRDVMPSFFGMTLDQLLRAKHPSGWARFETGELSEAAFLADFFADGRAYDVDGFKHCVRSGYAWMEGMEELLAQLRERGHAMHVLSNYPEWHRWIEDSLGLSRYLPWTFVSWRTGVRKPAPRAFLHAASELGVPAEACLFIDDRECNCDAARAVGMAAIQFRGDASALRAELGARGWL